LNSEGWGNCLEASLLRAKGPWQAGREFRSHGHALRRLFDKEADGGLGLDAVLCVRDRPTVCIKDARQDSDEEIEKLRRKLWNLGVTTLLLVERPTQVQLFSTFAGLPKLSDAILPDETISALEHAELALRLRQVIRGVETGAIYRGQHKPLFNPKQAVDQVLLENLREARDVICPKRSLDGYRRAHALLGRFLFSCYLLDRGIIGTPYLAKNGLPPAQDMLELLDKQKRDRADYLDTLFAALQRDFNGSLFGDADTTVVKPEEVDLLRRFLSGDDLRSGQGALFPPYDFSFIPVELISAIYQEFVSTEAEAEKHPEKPNQPGGDGQRRQGAYYTPPRVAELTVDIATEGWDSLLDKHCLDPACGSGVFLVILFVRMAEEWRNRNPDAGTRRRYDELMRLLKENLAGVDISLTACLVTCFSLYLAFLDQMRPKEIEELREALERDTRAKLLPRILWKRGEENPPQPPRLATVHEFDFFAMPGNPRFDLVIGNPPWVSRKDAQTAEAWLFDENSNPAAKGLKKGQARQTLFPAGEVACGFMWKAGLHVKPDGRVCQVLPSRVFLSNNTDRFQAHWLKRHRLEKVWLLADYSFILFPGADCPCFIGRYHRRREGEALGEFDFITPKVELLDPREALIPVQPEDQKILSEQEIIKAADRRECAFAWKKQHWGTPRDVRLVERLMRLPKLSHMVSKPPSSGTSPSEKTEGIVPKGQWWRGQGFEPFDREKYERDAESYGEPKTAWWGPTERYLPAQTKLRGLVLSTEETEAVGNRFRELRRSPNEKLFKEPLLLINQACTKFLFSDFDVLFQRSFQSICAPKADEDKLLFLTAVLASSLAQYLLFHTTANIGVERDKALLDELMALPFPLPQDMRSGPQGGTIVKDCAAILRALRADFLRNESLLARKRVVREAQHALNTKVYAYFGICEWERHLIEDTVNIFRPSSTPSSLDSKKLFTQQPSTFDRRKAYADTLVATFQGWTRSKSNLWAGTCLAPKAELAMFTFGAGGPPRDYKEEAAEKRVEGLLDRIRKATTRSQGTVACCLRGFAFYEGTQVHLLKPLNLRYWTRTAALNDADEIIAHMMEEDGWSA